MRTLLFDPFAGIAGDMTLGAFADLGVPEEIMIDAVRALNLPGCSLEFRKMVKKGIACKKAVVTEGENKPLRHLPEIVDVLEKASLDQAVRNRSLKIFQRLADVEAEVHGTVSENIHFHEIGAVDTLVDVVGNVAAFLYLGPDNVYTNPVRWGAGTIKISHGVYPIPTPATAILLRGIPGYNGEFEKEWTTPTGAALLADFITSNIIPRRFVPHTVGYGGGDREHPELANVLRIFLGKAEADRNEILQIETQVDDVTAEDLGYLHDLLMDSPALDWFLTPVQMKKNRPGTLITVLCDNANQEAINQLLFQNTSTIGLRITRVIRQELEREITSVDTPWGEAQLKVVSYHGNLKAAPEHEDCKRIALESGLPLAEVRRRILTIWLQQTNRNEEELS
jgi:uncharacterized protein (TIGR00299 family) protein